LNFKTQCFQLHVAYIIVICGYWCYGEIDGIRLPLFRQSAKRKL